MTHDTNDMIVSCMLVLKKQRATISASISSHPHAGKMIVALCKYRVTHLYMLSYILTHEQVEIEHNLLPTPGSLPMEMRGMGKTNILT